jgi:hypothetical protein
VAVALICNNSKSGLKTIGFKARGRGNDAPNRTPRSNISFKIRSKTIDSTLGGQGNDVPEPITAGREIIQSLILNIGFKGARPRQRRPEPSTANQEIIQTSFKTINSTAGDQGNDVPKRSPQTANIQCGHWKVMDSTLDSPG